MPKWGKAFEELQRVAKKKILVTVPLEKGVFWQTVSIFRGMHTRGHLHKIGSSDLKQGIGKEWNIVRHEVVATPSRHVNKVVGKKFGEKIGIYTALLFEKIARRFCQNVFGGDYTYEKLPVPEKEFAGCHFIGIDAEKLPFKDNSFDFVLCTEVLEHVPKWGKAFEELQRVAKKKILVTVPLEKGVFWQTVSIFRRMHTRGHLHKIGSSDLKQNIDNDWTVTRHEIVATPSRHVNKAVGKRFGEKGGMYAILLFEKNETKHKTKAKRK